MPNQMYREADQLRPPDWRYRTARYLAARRIFPARGSYDPMVCGLTKSLASHSPSFDSEDIATAYRIHTDMSRLRFAIEAGLLAGNYCDELAGTLGLSELAIVAYESLWFDVRTRLEARAFIMTEVIGAARKRSDEWCDYGWKIECYLGGKDAFTNLFSPRSLDTAQRILEVKQSAELMLARRIHAAIEDTSIESNKELVALLRNDRRNGKQERLYTDYEKNIDEMLRQIPIGLASRMSPDNPLYKFRNCSSELTPDETLRVGLGETLPNEKEIINSTFERLRPKPAETVRYVLPPASIKSTPPSPHIDGDPFR